MGFRSISKNRVLALMTVLALMMPCLFFINANAEASSLFMGDGTLEAPYLLSKKEDLLRLSRLVNDKGIDFSDSYFEIVSDIDMSGVDFTPIGAYGSEHYFFGVLDGNGHSIKNITIDIPDSNNGLFGVLGGTVLNLQMDGGTITGACCGVISSHAKGAQAQIINCKTQNVTVNGLRAGGIVDNFAGSVVNCVSAGCVLNGESACGGIASYAIEGDSFGNCYSFVSTNEPVSQEIIVDGSKQIGLEATDAGVIAEELNTNYRRYSNYAVPYFGILNTWEVSETGTVGLSNTRQKERYIANVSKLSGNGSIDNPYQINNADDLVVFRDAVNIGNNFYGEYIQQGADIDLSNEMWVPIGPSRSENYFFGIYDGNGYSITNLTTIKDGSNGFFGTLGGSVVNLKIDGGTVSGAYCGVISSHATGTQATILNCETRNVTVNAIRAGAIVDHFAGSVVNCVSTGCVLNGENAYGGITSYAIESDSFGNYYSFISTSEPDAEEKTAKGSEQIEPETVDAGTIAEKLNTNYRHHKSFKEPYFGICNAWAASENGAVELSNAKQKEIFISNVSKLSGSGSMDDPYQINDAEALVAFRDAVNSGNSFYGEYVQQRADIDLSNEVWIPIGQYGSDNYFYGTYDGKGHTISSLKTNNDALNGFFGVLGGTVANLGIESGLIRGQYCGAFSVLASSGSAAVVNCYNKAKVVGTSRAGGIVDNFTGSVIGCWSNCRLKGEAVGGIASYSADLIYLCRTSSDELVPTGTMEGRIVDSEDHSTFAGDETQKTLEALNNNISNVKKESGTKLGLFPYTLTDGQLGFSEKAYSFDLLFWIRNNTGLFISIIICVIVFLCLLFQVGPKKLYRDERKWFKRFILVFPPIFLFFYMFLIHSPIEFFIVNNSEFDFVFGDFAYKYIVYAVILSLGLSSVIAVIKGKLCDVVACAVLGMDLAAYFQLYFLNGSLELLDGREKAIDLAGNIVNASIWVVLIILPFVLFFVFKKYRAKVIAYLCGFLCLIQVVSIVTLIIQSPASVFERDLVQYYLTANDQYTVSANKNIIVFLIDTYSNAYAEELFEERPEIYAEELFEERPEIKEIVKDFTYYSNADCHYEGSVFSVNYITSGTDWDPARPLSEWCARAWNNEKNNNFYTRLSENGYRFNLYSNQLDYLSNDAKNDALGKVSNLVKTELDYQVNEEVMFNLFTNASIYRMLPLMIKGQYEFTASDYDSAYTVVSRKDKGIDVNVRFDNADFYHDLKTTGLKVDYSSNYYIIQHLLGLHDPYTTDENCQSVPKATMQQAELGCWKYVEEYLTLLKKLGVYDDATIILTADHGQHHDYHNAQPIFFIKKANEVHDEYVETNAPVSFTDIMPTVMYLAGGEYSDLGTTVYEHTEDEQRERALFVRMYDESLPKVSKWNSPTKSTLNCFYKYVYTGDREDLAAVGDKGPTEIVPWTDAFY